jgi:signal transduction histidine kinase
MKSNEDIRDFNAYIKRGAATIFTAYVVISILGYLIDIVSFYNVVTLMFYNNLSAIAVTLCAYFFYRAGKISLKTSLAIMLYTMVASVIFGTFTDLHSPVRLYIFLRDSLMIVILISIAALVVSKTHALIITILYLLTLIGLTIAIQSPFLVSSSYLIFLVVIAYVLIINYFVGVIEKSISEREGNLQLIKRQHDEVHEANEQLQERQLQIEEQSEELEAQAADLKLKSALLMETNVELGRLNATKDRFISILAHDLKNPFHAILGFAELLENEYNNLNDNEKLGYIKELNLVAQKTYTLLEDLLQWALSQSNSIQYNPKKLNVGLLFKECLPFISESAKSKKITIKEQLPPSCISFADEQMLNTIIRNLLSNAVKFTSVGGEIAIKCINLNNEIFVEISDTGIGMDEETQRNLFQMDKTHSKTGTSGETGTGLGLLLCKDFIEKNGGKIWFSSYPGKGSTFSFSLPAEI